MKTFLFVQNGGARPKVIARYTNTEHERFAFNVAYTRAHPDANMSKPLRACGEADHWWLVECEYALAGLWMIAPEWCNGRTAWPPPQGRILASGGKAVTP